MRKLLVVLCILFSSLSAYAQSMYSDAIAAMNKGEYSDAKIYWLALNDSRDSYGQRIKTCDLCIDFQNRAQRYFNAKQYVKAIEMYEEILKLNPYDSTAKTRKQRCQRLNDEHKAENLVKTYTNSSFAYTFKHPAYLVKQSSSTDEKVVFLSTDNKLRVNLTSAQKSLIKTNTQILNDVITSYDPSNITYKVIKKDWVVISGYLADGRVFYNKSIITTRTSQYDEPVTMLISVEVISNKNDSRGGKLAELVSQDFSVNQTGPVVQVKETDKDRWIRTKSVDSKEAYSKYITYAPLTSPYLTEARMRRTLCFARESFQNKEYLSAKSQFEMAHDYMTTSDYAKYEECCYQYCVYYDRTLYNLKEFMKAFPSHQQMRVVRGSMVKEYCEIRMFKEAKKYVKTHSNIWYGESIYYSEKQWLKYIKSEKQKAKRKYSAGTPSGVNNTSQKYSAGMNLY